MSNPLIRVMILRMLRWLAILALTVAVPAEAQVFKPKTGSSKKTTSHARPKKAHPKKHVTHKAAAKKSRAHEDDAPKVDPDYVKIIDDDE